MSVRIRRESATGGQGPGGKRVTLADVADRVGLHRATVSQILNNWPKCWASEETRRRVREAAETLGYRPNLAARSLRAGCSRVVGIVAPGFVVSRAMGFTDAAALSDYTVIVSSHPNDAASEDRVIHRLLDRAVDGLAVYPVDPGPHEELRRLVERGFPVVTFDGANLLDFHCDDMSVDYDKVGELQAAHLLALGRRRFCLANTIPSARINDIREESIRRALARAKAPPALDLRLRIDASTEFGDDAAQEAGVREFLERRRGQVDAVLGFDNLVSVFMRVLREQGLRVPEDVAVIGAGNSVVARYGMMPLTSVGTSDEQAGARAFALLLDRMQGKGATAGFRRLTNPVTLFERESTVGRKPRA